MLKKLGGEKWLDVYDEPLVNTHQGDRRGREQTTTEPARGSECSAVLLRATQDLKGQRNAVVKHDKHLSHHSWLGHDSKIWAAYFSPRFVF